jgi:hypothetical protein
MASESVLLDTSRADVPEFSNNEAYGAIQSGVSWAWSGTIDRFNVWHAARHGVTAMPSEKLVIDRLTARGDPDVLATAGENAVGVWVANYVSKSVAVTNANVQGLRVGVSSPFFYGQAQESGRAGSLTVEDSYFRTYIGVSVATGYVDAAPGGAVKRAVVRSSRFDLPATSGGAAPPEAISMNYGMTPNDARPRDPIAVYDFNKQAGKNFKVYYSLQAPAAVAPCHDTMPAIDGWVCTAE